MEIGDIFEIASRRKFRFPYKGNIAVEDLWDLSKEEMDDVFKALNSALKKSSEESLFGERSEEDEELEMKISLIKYIAKVKVQEIQGRRNEAVKKAERQKIMSIIEEKEDAALRDESVEQLRARLEAMK